MKVHEWVGVGYSDGRYVCMYGGWVCASIVFLYLCLDTERVQVTGMCLDTLGLLSRRAEER